MNRESPKFNAGMNFVGECIRAGKLINKKQIQKACKISPAYASIVIRTFRYRGVLVPADSNGNYCTKSLKRTLNRNER